MNLTPRQRDTIDFIRKYQMNNGMSPTMQEVADGLNVSKVTIFEMVKELERKGVIRRDRNKSRSIVIIGDEKTAPLMAAIGDAVTFIASTGNSALAERLQRVAAGAVL